MSKFIVDKINDRRIDIDLGGHWEALMNYIKRKSKKQYWEYDNRPCGQVIPCCSRMVEE